MASPFDQSRYQVRLEWGTAGLERLAPADVVVVVDTLSFSTRLVDRVGGGGSVALDGILSAPAGSPDGSLNGAVVAHRAAATESLVLIGCLRNASAVADVVLAEQQRRAARTSIAVIPAGERTSSDPAAPVRFAVEDQFAAGAIIDALGARGIDHTSPEGAAACESFRGLRGALRHLLTASGSGQELIERGRRDDVLHAAEVDAVTVVPRFSAGLFTA